MTVCGGGAGGSPSLRDKINSQNVTRARGSDPLRMVRIFCSIAELPSDIRQIVSPGEGVGSNRDMLVVWYMIEPYALMTGHTYRLVLRGTDANNIEWSVSSSQITTNSPPTGTYSGCFAE